MAARPEIVTPAAIRLQPQAQAKPWGRRRLGDWGLGMCDTLGGVAIGEIHHVLPGGGDPELLVKTLFTSERLSVQVHPDMAQAQTRGFARGKDEAWVVLAAEPGATIGLGLTAASDAAALRAAALDGSIAGMLEWHDCAAGDVFFTPAGTIHAIGAGVTLFEIQQNLDVTYRLFDYGRGRELHLDDGLAVAAPGRWQRPAVGPSPGAGRELLVEGPGFVIERVRVDGRGALRPSDGRPVWMAVVGGLGSIDGATFSAGDVWMAHDAVRIAGEAEVLLAYQGGAAVQDLWVAG